MRALFVSKFCQSFLHDDINFVVVGLLFTHDLFILSKLPVIPDYYIGVGWLLDIFILARSVIIFDIFNNLFILIAMFFFAPNISHNKVVIHLTSYHIISQFLLPLVPIHFMLVVFTGVFPWNVKSMCTAIFLDIPTFYGKILFLVFLLLILGAFLLFVWLIFWVQLSEMWCLCWLYIILCFL